MSVCDPVIFNSACAAPLFSMGLIFYWHFLVSVFQTGVCVRGLLLQHFKHLDSEKPGMPVKGMGLLIGLLPSGQVSS